MAAGCANGWLPPAPLRTVGEAKERWMASSSLQKRIIGDIWGRRAHRASWGNINDGKVALGHLEETTGSGYFTT
eukprot:8408757-Pyramimonas_sp.AAC.1